MKKLTLSIGLVAAMLSAKAQDTICTYFENKDVYEFNYQNDSIIGTDTQTTRFYTIKVGYREVLCLHLSDKKTKVRKVIITYSDGETVTDILDSKFSLAINNNPRGDLVSKSIWVIRLVSLAAEIGAKEPFLNKKSGDLVGRPPSGMSV